MRIAIWAECLEKFGGGGLERGNVEEYGWREENEVIHRHKDSYSNENVDFTSCKPLWLCAYSVLQMCI